MKDYKQGMIDAYTKIIAAIDTLDPEKIDSISQVVKEKAKMLRNACLELNKYEGKTKSGYLEYLERTKNLSE